VHRLLSAVAKSVLRMRNPVVGVHVLRHAMQLHERLCFVHVRHCGLLVVPFCQLLCAIVVPLEEGAVTSLDALWGVQDADE